MPRVTTLRLRPEDPADTGAVRRVLAAAFARPDVSTPPEVGLVEELRDTDAWLPMLAMVAEYGGEVVGYALLTRVRVKSDDHTVPALALGPVAVAPHRRRIGLGSAVVQAAIEAATELGERLVVVLGDPVYYHRFGFCRADRMGLTSPWSGLGDPWQALVLPPATSGEGPPPRGEVIFPPPWSKV
ncbi:N-acetyltransferase [Micromonospora peucetia]|uniref:GNAT family N-acetyltransferase n=1 Tax=Micromonospora peucetia TaxID=47871 RepID=UPI00331D3203